MQPQVICIICVIWFAYWLLTNMNLGLVFYDYVMKLCTKDIKETTCCVWWFPFLVYTMPLLNARFQKKTIMNVYNEVKTWPLTSLITERGRDVIQDKVNSFGRHHNAGSQLHIRGFVEEDRCPQDVPQLFILHLEQQKHNTLGLENISFLSCANSTVMYTV